MTIGKIFQRDKKLAIELDEQMDFASNLCEEALKNSDFCKLKDGINLGGEIFRRWGLCNSSMSEHMNKLLSWGARAVKPIGSGLGGYVLSLWEEDPFDFFHNSLPVCEEEHCIKI
jgi:mevalonate kinase